MSQEQANEKPHRNTAEMDLKRLYTSQWDRSTEVSGRGDCLPNSGKIEEALYVYLYHMLVNIYQCSSRTLVMKRSENTGLLSKDESIVWLEFQRGNSTSAIAEQHQSESWSPAYVSRVLNRARQKIADVLKEHADSHRLDVESLVDYKGLLIGFDYQANAQVYIAYTEKQGIVVWYRHDSYAGKLCPECPKEPDCEEALQAMQEEHALELRQDEKRLPMTQRSIALFNKLAAKEIPRYKRKEGGD